MPPVMFDIRATIIESGKAEILRCGYEKASLRNICRKAGVTTGAFYSNFSSKEELLAVILEDELGRPQDILDILAVPEPPDSAAVAVLEMAFFEFAAAHRDAMRLLLDCSAGSPYEAFRDQLVERLEAIMCAHCRYEGIPCTRESVHMVAFLECQCCCETMRGSLEGGALMQMIEQMIALKTVGLQGIRAAM